MLGTNPVRFVDQDGATCRSIVPAKPGYVGLWQWDAYFIAIGVAHGDFDAALEQLRNAVKFQADTGQLPDVLFPGGVLANSSDLPQADRLKLEAGALANRWRVHRSFNQASAAGVAIEQILGKRSDAAHQKVVEEFADVVVTSVLSDIHHPGRSATNYPLPTMALDEDGYRANIMWRGPTWIKWINTTFFIAEGLARQGYPEEARTLRTAILDNIEKAGGPVEYLNSSTGIRCEHAVRSFSWSAALYVDCAVREFSRSVEASRG